jgi:hypothetical protein
MGKPTASGSHYYPRLESTDFSGGSDQPFDQNRRLSATTAKRDKKERSFFLSLLICPALSGYPDYRAKRIEYCVLDILEYWIVDLVDHCVTICVLEEGSYTDHLFTGGSPIASPVFPNLQLTAAQILAVRGVDEVSG